MFFGLFVFIACASAAIDGLRRQKTKLCTRKLERSLYQPQVCGQTYLENLDRQLRQYGPLLFTSQRDSIISQFEKQYGVDVEVHSPFETSSTITCDTFRQGSRSSLSTTAPNVFSFQESSSGTFVSASLTDFVTANNGAAFNFRITLTSPSDTIQVIYNNTCTSAPVYSVSFADSGTTLSTSSDCIGQLSSLSRAIKPTVPFYLFSGEQVAGRWSVTLISSASVGLTGFNLNICYSKPTYARNNAYSNLNSPAFSRTNGISKITSIYRSANDEILYVSINADKLICPN